MGAPLCDVMGQDLDIDWYHKVVDACGLGPDFEILPDGEWLTP